MGETDRSSRTNVPRHTSSDDNTEYQYQQQSLYRTLDIDEESIFEIDGHHGRCLLDNLQAILGAKHVHSVFGVGRHPNDHDRCATIKRLHLSGRDPKPFIAIAQHFEKEIGRNHIHVLHACAFSNRSCRCRFLGEYPRGPYKCLRRGDVTPEYIRNTVQYLNTWPRELYYLHIPGNEGQVLRTDESVQVCGCVNCSSRETLDESIAGHEICGQRHNGRSHYETHNGIDHGHTSLFQTAPASRPGDKEEEIYQLVKKLSITPINNTVLSVHWLNSPYKFLPRSSPILQTIFNTWSRELKHMTITELSSIYQHTNPFFSCTSHHISDFYYNLDETLVRANFILQHQFPDMDIRIEFLQQLLLILTKQNGKKNTLCITGPPSSGKTYFVRFISSFFISIGQVRNFNRNDSFPLNDCTDKRILHCHRVDHPQYQTIPFLYRTGFSKFQREIKIKSETVIT